MPDTVKKPRKRNRVPISCVICRRRKVKCDKQKPQCQNCIKNNVQHLCHYLEPVWAQPLPNELEHNGYVAPDNHTQTDDNSDVKPQLSHSNSAGNTTTNSAPSDVEKQLLELQEKVKTLQSENSDLKKKIAATPSVSRATSPVALNNSNTSSLPAIKTGVTTNDDYLDAIFNSNILFIAQKSNQYNIPITYQISVFSWMFMVKNDLYLNDLWMKILKLRQHYEYYYSSKGSMDKNMISHYRNYNSKIKSSASLKKAKVIPQDKTFEHTSKLKKFLEKSLILSHQGQGPNHTQGEQQKVSRKPSNAEIEFNAPTETQLNNSMPNICPVTGVIGVCPMGNSSGQVQANAVKSSGPVVKMEQDVNADDDTDAISTPGGSIENDKLTPSQTPIPTHSATPDLKRKLSKKSSRPIKFAKCPVLNPNNSSLSTMSALNSPAVSSKRVPQHTSIHSHLNPHDDTYSDNDDILDDHKVCPLMVGDAKALFKEKLTKMNISAIRDSYTSTPSPIGSSTRKRIVSNSPMKAKGSSLIPSGPTTPMSEIKPQDTEKLTNYVPIAMKPERSANNSRQNSIKRNNNGNDGSGSRSAPPTAGGDFNTNSRTGAGAGSNVPFPSFTTGPTSANVNMPKGKRVKSISPFGIKLLNYNNTKQIIAVIEQYLPSKKVVGLLIDRFFDKLYIYMPYVDEESFRTRVAAILNNGNNSTASTPGNEFNFNNQKIRLSNIGTQYCDEFLTLCLILVIIRLSWLSLPAKPLDAQGQGQTQQFTQNEMLLMKPENFISFVLVDLVKEIFSSAKIMTKPSVIIFQVGLFLKIYSTVSPEDGFDTDDSYTKNSAYNPSSGAAAATDPGTPNSTASNSNDLSGDLSNESPNMNSPNFISMLVQLARTIGLNRDPLNFKNFYSTATDDKVTVGKLFRRRHLWRKLWYGLLFLTIEANLSLGDYRKGLPIELDMDPTLGNIVNTTWDCRLPGGIEQGVLEKTFQNSKCLQRELCAVQIFRESIASYRWVYQGMKLLFAVDKPPKTLDLENVIFKLNEIICEGSKFGFGIDLIMGDKEIVNPFRARNSAVWVKKYTKQIKVMRLKVHLIVKNMIFSLNYLLFLNHEQKLSRLLGQKNSSIEKIKKQRAYIEFFFESALLSSIENFKLFVQFMDDSKTVFPNCSTELMIYPFLMILNHRSHEFLISLILRIQQSSPVIIEILKKNNIDPAELQKRLFTYLETFILRLDMLTKDYYYAWVLRRLVKFFYNLLTNSQKFFRLNFKKINAVQKRSENPVAEDVDGDNHHEKANTDSASKDASHNAFSKSNAEKSAFEIAFGTSKLPPVTDFQHDDRREINFNPTMSNSEALVQGSLMDMNNMNINGMGGMGLDTNFSPDSNISSSGLGLISLQNMNLNSVGGGIANMDFNSLNVMGTSRGDSPAGSILQGMQADMHGEIIRTPSGASEVNMNTNGLMGAMSGLARNSSSAAVGNNNHGILQGLDHGRRVSTNGLGSGGMYSLPHRDSISDDLNEIFDDQFLNEIGGFGADNADNTNMLGLNRGLSMNGVTTYGSIDDGSRIKVPYMQNNNVGPNGNGMESNLNKVAVMNGVSSSSLFNNIFSNQLNNDLNNVNTYPSYKSEMFNSLNEIDFTNVDLLAPTDNMTYQMSPEMHQHQQQQNLNALQQIHRQQTQQPHLQGNNRKNSQGGDSNLGNWNFF